MGEDDNTERVKILTVLFFCSGPENYWIIRIMKRKALINPIGIWTSFLILLFTQESDASITLSIQNPQYSNWGVAAQAVLVSTAVDLENQFNDTLMTADKAEFLTQIGNANALSTRSMLSPGVTDAETKITGSFSLSGALSGGINVNSTSNSLPPVGVAAQSGITLGANGDYIKIFRGLDPKRVMYHLSFYKVDIGSYFKNSKISSKALQVSTGVSYQLYPRRNWLPGIDFTGIRLSSAFSYADFNASYTTPFTLSSGGISMVSDVTMTVDSGVFSFSNEATVGVRFLYFLDLYTGLGMDLNLGSTNLLGTSSNGSVSASQGGVVGYKADAHVSGDVGSVSPTTAQLRLILGTQINTGPISIFAQANASTPNAYSLNIGGKFGF